MAREKTMNLDNFKEFHTAVDNNLFGAYQFNSGFMPDLTSFKHRYYRSFALQNTFSDSSTTGDYIGWEKLDSSSHYYSKLLFSIENDITAQETYIVPRLPVDIEFTNLTLKQGICNMIKTYGGKLTIEHNSNILFEADLSTWEYTQETASNSTVYVLYPPSHGISFKANSGDDIRVRITNEIEYYVVAPGVITVTMSALPDYQLVHSWYAENIKKIVGEYRAWYASSNLGIPITFVPTKLTSVETNIGYYIVPMTPITPVPWLFSYTTTMAYGTVSTGVYKITKAGLYAMWAQITSQMIVAGNANFHISLTKDANILNCVKAEIDTNSLNCDIIAPSVFMYDSTMIDSGNNTNRTHTMYYPRYLEADTYVFVAMYAVSNFDKNNPCNIHECRFQIERLA